MGMRNFGTVVKIFRGGREMAENFYLRKSDIYSAANLNGPSEMVHNLVKLTCCN